MGIGPVFARPAAPCYAVLRRAAPCCTLLRPAAPCCALGASSDRRRSPCASPSSPLQWGSWLRAAGTGHAAHARPGWGSSAGGEVPSMWSSLLPTGLRPPLRAPAQPQPCSVSCGGAACRVPLAGHAWTGSKCGAQRRYRSLCRKALSGFSIRDGHRVEFGTKTCSSTRCKNRYFVLKRVAMFDIGRPACKTRLLLQAQVPALSYRQCYRQGRSGAQQGISRRDRRQGVRLLRGLLAACGWPDHLQLWH